MNQFNLSNFINKVVTYSLSNFKGGGHQNLANNANAGAKSDIKFQLPTGETLTQNLSSKVLQNIPTLKTLNQAASVKLKMNGLSNLENGLYIKDLMKLPKEMSDILVIIQNKTTMTKDLPKLASTNIDISELMLLMQQGSKEAMNKLVISMSNASKQGINDLSQIKETMKLISEISIAGKENPTQTVKNFMLLYLPWLPLQEGVDFDLEIKNSDEEDGDSETSVSIMISTKNYGNVKIILILSGMNSINILINCTEEFPQKELLKKINAEGNSHSIQSNVTFEEKIKKQDVGRENNSHQAQISMSTLTQVNPFLLLMANAIIRYTIELDNQAN